MVHGPLFPLLLLLLELYLTQVFDVVGAIQLQLRLRYLLWLIVYVPNFIIALSNLVMVLRQLLLSHLVLIFHFLLLHIVSFSLLDQSVYPFDIILVHLLFLCPQ